MKLAKNGKEVADFELVMDIQELKTKTRENWPAFKRLNELIFALARSNRAVAAPQYILEEPYNTWAAYLTVSMELFILGHEYSHVLIGHLAQKKMVSSFLLPEKVDEIVYRQNQEYDADFYGMRLMLSALTREKRFTPMMYCGS